MSDEPIRFPVERVNHGAHDAQIAGSPDPEVARGLASVDLAPPPGFTSLVAQIVARRLSTRAPQPMVESDRRAA